MPKMIERLQFEVDRFALYTGLRPTRLLVSPIVLSAYLQELTGSQIPDAGAARAEFRGYPVEVDPKLPAGAVLVDSQRGPLYPLPPPVGFHGPSLPEMMRRFATVGTRFDDEPMPSPVSAGDSEASPRPWRVSEHDPSGVVDADGKPVCNAWHANAALTAGDVALIVAAVNGSPASTLTVQPNDVVVVTSGRGVEMKTLHLALKARFPEWRGFVILTTPGGDALTCVDKRALYERLRAELEPGPPFGPTGPPRSDCVLPLGHPGPCIPEVSVRPGPLREPFVRMTGMDPADPCPRDPVCDQRAGHEGPCRYEFPAGLPVSPEAQRAIAEGRAALARGDSVSIEEAESYVAREREARALSSDCRLPLRHAVGCECGRL